MSSPNDRFLEAIEAGNDIDTAASLLRMPADAVWRLLERGKKEQTRIYAGVKPLKPKASEEGALKFWEDVAEARAKAISLHVKNIRNAAIDGDWKASKYALEHIHPNVYGTNGSMTEIESNRLNEIEAY